MALIKCPECGKEISDTCEQCIHCGYRLKNPHDGYLSQKPQNINVSSTTEHIKQESEYLNAIVASWIIIVLGIIMIIVSIAVAAIWVYSLIIMGIPGILFLLFSIPFLLVNKRMLNKYYR